MNLLEFEEVLRKMYRFIREHSDGITDPARGHDGNAISKWAAEELIGMMLEATEPSSPPLPLKSLLLLRRYSTGRTHHRCTAILICWACCSWRYRWPASTGGSDEPPRSPLGHGAAPGGLLLPGDRGVDGQAAAHMNCTLMASVAGIILALSVFAILCLAGRNRQPLDVFAGVLLLYLAFALTFAFGRDYEHAQVIHAQDVRK